MTPFIFGLGAALLTALCQSATDIGTKAATASYVIAIKRMRALFTVAASGLLLRESIRERVLGAAIMLAGAALAAFAQS